MEKTEYFIADEEYKRLDICVADAFEDISRSHAQKLIDAQKITLNGKYVKAKAIVHCGDEISILIPDPVPIEILPEDIPIEVVYEDKDLAVINKQQGLTVHPANNNLYRNFSKCSFIPI
jgi:Pseudouridylate synthases, 23S RNA-specific